MSLNTENTKNIGWSTPLPQGIKAASDWLPLIPFGIFPRHPRGVHKLAKPDAKEIVHHFNSLCNLITRHFQGLSVLTEYKSSCGSISHLEVRDSAIWAIIKWNDFGKKFIKESPNCFLNPIWMTRSQDNDVFIPFKLFEIILSHESNIPIETPIVEPKTKSRTKSILNKKSITENLTGKHSALSKNARTQFLSLVDIHMQQTNATYLESWHFVKFNNPELYNNIVE